MLVPRALGTGLAVLGRGAFTALGETHTDTRSFVLFRGVATSVTALPVLASIVRERGLSAGIIIHEKLFTILVLMALITTIATGPLITAIGGRGSAQEAIAVPREETAPDLDDVS